MKKKTSMAGIEPSTPWLHVKISATKAKLPGTKDIDYSLSNTCVITIAPLSEFQISRSREFCWVERLHVINRSRA